MSNTVKHLLEFGPFRIDPEQRRLFRNQQPVPLSPKAFDLLLLLAERSGQVVLKDDLMKILWPDTFVEESNLGQHIFQLRKALGERAHQPTYIATVPGRGYRLASRVRIVPPEGDEKTVPESHSGPRVATEQERPIDRPADPTLDRVRRLVTGLLAVAVLLAAAWFLRPS